ncbi:phytase [Maribacter confluentis]|uniref:Phytase n=1 Tax=Maribacter confluentis TaxID=1656093 RepID=A0ABT8RLI9_9FLAO|nr:phytase [Maribacter confluentis]MDO1511635.1 phytase [Maribacter confluentis]
MLNLRPLFIITIIFFQSCKQAVQHSKNALRPKTITEQIPHDTDDPAIWINEDNPEESLIIGTDKNEDGGLYVYDLNGKIIKSKTVKGLKRPNNVDIEEFEMGEEEFSIAVTTERLTNKIRIFRVPEMTPIDNGGIPVFEGEEFRAPMGVGLYKDADDQVFAFVGRKSGPADGYIWQYKLEGDAQGNITGKKVREFGKYSGKNEIEAIVVDDELGYVYYSDEGIGVRKYYADVDRGNEELALFANQNFTEDHEGLSIYQTDLGTGYIIVSDQQANKFHLFSREGSNSDPHDHQLVKVVELMTNESDGSEVTNASLGTLFPKGLFVAMSDDKTFHFYSWEDIAGENLLIAPDGLPQHTMNAIHPKYITENVVFDTDDPAIWIDKKDPSNSFIIGTDKEDGGGLYAFDLQGKIIKEKCVLDLQRPNNVDIAYDFKLNGKLVDIAVTTERSNNQLRIFSLPDMKPIDGGGLPVFTDREISDPMGIALYTDQKTKEIYAIVGPKIGPATGYLSQYKIHSSPKGTAMITKVRDFGNYSGVKEIEAIAVDNELGYIYYSDEVYGVRKYYADPKKGNEELALFGTKDFGRDIEGISIYKNDDGTGYILISDQQQNTFNIYPREGAKNAPNNHVLLKSVELLTLESDGSDVTSVAINEEFPKGMFVGMSTDKTFHIYDWRDIMSE